jgi:hypothetical protein
MYEREPAPARRFAQLPPMLMDVVGMALFAKAETKVRLGASTVTTVYMDRGKP